MLCSYRVAVMLTELSLKLVCSNWLQIFLHKFRDRFARSLKMEAIFVRIFIQIKMK